MNKKPDNQSREQIGELGTAESVEMGEETRLDIRRLELISQLDLENQYADRLETMKHFGFLDESGEAGKDDIPPPSFEKTINTFKLEEFEVASKFQKPILLLLAETSFAAKVNAIDNHRIIIMGMGVHQTYTLVDSIFDKHDSGSSQIAGWRVAIVDGAQEMELYEGDFTTEGYCSHRFDRRKERRNPVEKGMNVHLYAILMMESIKNGNPIDRRTSTFLDDERDRFIWFREPSAGWSVTGVSFQFDLPEVMWQAEKRFRSSVGGDILLVNS